MIGLTRFEGELDFKCKFFFLTLLFLITKQYESTINVWMLCVIYTWSNACKIAPVCCDTLTLYCCLIAEMHIQYFLYKMNV